MAETDMTAAEAREDWWAAWWEADYSWAGLAKKRWRGWRVDASGAPVRDRPAIRKTTSPATLQHFWAAERGRLVRDPDGVEWTVAHAPPRWRNGAFAKAGWSEAQHADVLRAIEAAVARLPPDAFEPRAPTETSEDRPSTRLARYENVWGAPLDGTVLRDAPRAVLDLPYIGARQAAMLGSIGLPASGGRWDLRGCLFEGAVLVSDQGDARVEDVRLSGCTFLRDVTLATLGAQSFMCVGSRFLGALGLSGLEVAGRADFTRTVFQDDVSFEAVDASELRLRGCAFSGRVMFEAARIRALSAAGVTFCDDVDLRNAIFDRVDLSAATALRTVRFSGATFTGTTNFRRANFGQAVYFDDVIWPVSHPDFRGAFRQARLGGFSDFSGAGFQAFAAFDGAALESEVRLSPAAFQRGAGFDKALAQARAAGGLEALGHGVRALKQASEKMRDRVMEHRFYRYELAVRTHLPETRLVERAVYRAYGLSSNYGSSMGWPLAWAVALWIGGAFAYLAIGAVADLPGFGDLALHGRAHPALFDAANLSARSIFSLFSVWSARPSNAAAGAMGSFEDALLWGDPAAGLVVRLMSSVQSVLAGVLLFLCGLAIRRRFQIN